MRFKIKINIFSVINVYFVLLLAYSLVLDCCQRYFFDPKGGISVFIRIQQYIYWPSFLIIFVIVIVSFFMESKDKKLFTEADDGLRCRFFCCFMIIVFLSIAGIVRFYHLDMLPINFDEGDWFYWCVNYAQPQEVISYGHMPVLFGGLVRPLFPFFLFTVKFIIKDPVFALRVPAVILGVVTVLLNYLFVRKSLGEKTAVFSSFWLALLPWHIIYSRLGEEKVLVPLFGILIFYSLYLGIREKREWSFILSWCLLGIGGFYVYQPAIIYIGIFFIILLVSWRDLRGIPPHVFICGILLFFIFVYPFISLYLTNDFNFLHSFYRYYQKDIFTQGTFLVDVLQNASGNFLDLFKFLFFQTPSFFLYGEALKAPLLVNCLVFLLLLAGVVNAFVKGRLIDKILLSWLLGGIVFILCFINFITPRYLLLLLPVVLILAAEFLNQLIQSRWLRYPAVLAFILIVFLQTLQLYDYYNRAGKDLDTWRDYSYGCSAAADLLLQQDDLKGAIVVIDNRMAPLKVYFNYNKEKTGYRRDKINIVSGALNDIADYTDLKMAYYLIWSPESHPEDYIGSIYRRFYFYFKQIYPEAEIFKILYYPNGLPAIEIYKRKGDSFILPDTE